MKNNKAIKLTGNMKTISTFQSNLKEYKGSPVWSQKSSSRKILLPELGGIFVSPLLSEGNSKLDKGVMIFDLLAGVDCPDCASCISTCYALKSQRQYPATYNKRLINSHLARFYPELLERLLISQLTKSKRAIVRIHTSGDFFSLSYTKMWKRIIKLFPTKRFYCYTKSHFVSPKMSDKLENLNIVDSLVSSIDGCETVKNYGELKDMLKLAVAYGGKLCPYGVAKRPVACMRECFHCLHEQYVFFKIH